MMLLSIKVAAKVIDRLEIVKGLKI